MTGRHPLDEATLIDWMEPGRGRGATHPAYGNMTGPFGGTTAAILLRSVIEHPERRGVPVALTVNYCTPIADGPYELRAKLARGGRSVQHWTMELVQNDAIAATASAITGTERETWSHQAASAPQAPPFESLAPIGSNVRVAWLGCYDIRFYEGSATFDAPEDAPPGSARTSMWIADRPARPLDFVSLAALSDAFIVRLFHLRGRPAAAGTVSITTYFYATETDLARQGTRPLVGIADARVFRRGFHDQIGELWSADGALLAVTTQTVWYKA
jgi:acyl-CoA thioesterase